MTAPKSGRDDALAVVRRLREAGHVAYFAGGCVRDVLLGLEPKDYDVATDAPPQRVRDLFRNSQAVGAAFGVILVRHGGSQVEVATFRSDGAYEDGRRPTEVRFTTAEEDAKRRDFTINGLFYDPLEDRVIDFVGGREDLQNKVLRAIGDPDMRFGEDHLRLLRAVRFAARFSLQVDPATGQAISRHADHLKRISPERVADELRAMLLPPTRREAWDMLWRFGLLPTIFRTLPEKPRSQVPHDRYSGPLFPELAAGHPVRFALALAALVVCYRMATGESFLAALSLPSGQKMGQQTRPVLLELAEVQRSVQACRTTLKISNEESDFMTGVMHVGPLLRDDPPSVATMKRFLATQTSSEARTFLDALLRSESGLTRIIWLREQFARLETDDCAPPPLITGDDLTAAGLRPGPVFKRVLDAVYDEQLEGRVATKEQAMKVAMRLASQSPLPPGGEG